MNSRVVISGMGICAPNGLGLEEFRASLKNGRSGIRFVPELQKLNFGCQIAGTPQLSKDHINKYFTPLQQRGLNSSGLVYGVMAGAEAWEDAGLPIYAQGRACRESGIIFGTGMLGADKFRESIYLVDAGNVRRLGSTAVQQTMSSGVSAFLGGMLGCGNQVTANSSACATGTEALLMAWERIRAGFASRVLTGSCNDSGPYIWGGFDAMRILPRNFNATPEAGSRPMSVSAAGFVPGSGAGALLVESLESARARGANIYAELLGGAVNSGGQREGGSMTAPNSEAVRLCLEMAISNAGIRAEEIDVVNGHLTATAWDVEEVRNWCRALKRKGMDFPYLNSFKGLFGHCLAGAGSMECVASLLQFREAAVFGNRNCEDLHPEIERLVAASRIPRKTIPYAPRILAKASFGFGDVNACVIFKAFKE